MSLKSIEILHSKSGKSLFTLDDVNGLNTIFDVKQKICQQSKLFSTAISSKCTSYSEESKYYPDRQQIKADPKSKPLKDEEPIKNFQVDSGKLILYFKDLGPQVGWTTVFLTEYAGPLVIYLIFYLRPSFIYSGYSAKALAKYDTVQQIACLCWTFHYAKRLLETIFIHRFSHATMPIKNIFKNSAYYWGFAAWVAYFVNHPLFTKPTFGNLQVYLGLAGFLISELGNFSVHLALRDLRPPGTKERRIPFPTSNPFTQLFSFVSCPNYTYEIYAWISFSIMTQTLTAALFTICGAFQMIQWALGKHRNYRKEFEKYPRGRKAIFPFLI